MAAIIRDAPFGQALRLISKGSLRYDDEVNRLDAKILAIGDKTSASSSDIEKDDTEKVDSEKAIGNTRSSSETRVAADVTRENIVTWDGPDDPDNPQNWSAAKKTFVFFQICLLTFTSMC